MKALLVLDEMPIRCGDCILMHWNTEETECECYPMHKVIDPLSHDFDKYPAGEGHPDWCPLKELPDFKGISTDDNMIQYGSYHRGWNACLDEILGTED